MLFHRILFGIGEPDQRARRSYRGSPAGIWGTKGIIPHSVDAGATFTQTFTFPLPPDVINPNYVHIIGFVNQFSGTDPSGNEVFDAAKLKLTTTSLGVVPQQAFANLDGMSAMPNPFRGTTEVRYTAASDERDITFSAFDLLGREVAKFPAQNVSGTTCAATFNANDLANGTYVIVVRSSKGSHYIRVVSQR